VSSDRPLPPADGCFGGASIHLALSLTILVRCRRASQDLTPHEQTWPVICIFEAEDVPAATARSCGATVVSLCPPPALHP